jgi:hypothetical protein
MYTFNESFSTEGINSLLLLVLLPTGYFVGCQNNNFYPNMPRKIAYIYTTKERRYEVYSGVLRDTVIV